MRKGFDPRDFALVAEGGAGPMFAANIAAEVGTPAVIVPPYPGVTAALGLLVTDTVYEYVTTTYQRMSAAQRHRAPGALRGAREAGARSARTRRDRRRPHRSSSAWPTAATWARATSCASRPARARRRRLGGQARGAVPRRARARVLAPLRGVRHRDPEHPGARHRPDRAAPDARGGARRRVAGRRADRRARGLVPRRRRAARAGDASSTTAPGSSPATGSRARP